MDGRIARINDTVEVWGVYLFVGVALWGLAEIPMALVTLMTVAPGSTMPWQSLLPSGLPEFDVYGRALLWVAAGAVTVGLVDRRTGVDLTERQERRQKVIRACSAIIFAIGATVVLVTLWLIGSFG